MWHFPAVCVHAPGRLSLGLIMNVLCGRLPIYRVEDFKCGMCHFFSERIWRRRCLTMTPSVVFWIEFTTTDTWKLFSEVCIQAFHNFNVDCSIIHEDTTSVNLWGEYLPRSDDPMRITTYGFSKDKRPDLKQFVLSLLERCRRGRKMP